MVQHPITVRDAAGEHLMCCDISMTRSRQDGEAHAPAVTRQFKRTA
jgi:hypothetical protein